MIQEGAGYYVYSALVILHIVRWMHFCVDAVYLSKRTLTAAVRHTNWMRITGIARRRLRCTGRIYQYR